MWHTRWPRDWSSDVCSSDLHSAAQVTITDPATGRRIVSTPSGTAQTVVWNPWERQAAQIVDIIDGAWPQFVCIEPSLAKDQYLPLAPCQSNTIGDYSRVKRLTSRSRRVCI